MKWLTIANSSHRMPAVGQGMTGLGTREYHDRELVAKRMDLLRYGVAHGLNFIDTAALYGNGFSESIVGEAIKGIRSQCFLASKFYPYDHFTATDVRATLMASLARLQTDYLDLYQIHWPNPLMKHSEIMGVLEKLVQEGLVRYIGTSNYCHNEIQAANADLERSVVISNQYEFNLLNRDIFGNIRPYDPHTILIAYSPLNQGRLVCHTEQYRVIGDIGASKGASAASVVLAWVLHHKNMAAVVKTSSKKHMDDVIAALELTLSGDEINAIESIFSDSRLTVEADQIVLHGDHWRQPYRSLKEAIDNPLDLIPSPMAMAKRFQRGVLEMRVRLVHNPAGGYDIDTYDPFDQIKKYWGWVIAFPGKPIPAFVLEPKSGR